MLSEDVYLLSLPDTIGAPTSIKGIRCSAERDFDETCRAFYRPVEIPRIVRLSVIGVLEVE